MSIKKRSGKKFGKGGTKFKNNYRGNRPLKGISKA